MASGWVRARAPATIANVGPGFDVFCLAVRGLSDEEMDARIAESGPWHTALAIMPWTPTDRKEPRECPAS